MRPRLLAILETQSLRTELNMPLPTPPLVRKVHGIEEDPRQQETPSTEPAVLTILCGTNSGPFRLRITQGAAVELMATLNMHPLSRGSK
jgi:hypothetical protein